MDPCNPLPNKNPLDLQYIQSCQEKDAELIKACQEDNNFIKIAIKVVIPIHHKGNEFDKPTIVIDTIIGLPEVIPVDDATSASVTIAFEDNWLSRYPAPLR